MLKLVLGRAGAGKTAFALEKAGELAAQDQKVIYIVPEQFSFETEKMLSQKPGALLHTEVLSFTRLCSRIFREYGGFANEYIDDCGRHITMRLALQQVADTLRIYGKQASNPAFIKMMVGAVNEYKLCGVSPAMLVEAAGKISNAMLKEKLSDLSIISGAYDAMVTNRFADPMDDLTRLAERLNDLPYFKEKTVIIDAFISFTYQEKQVIRSILKQADDVYVTLCADSLDCGSVGLFAPVQKTANSLIEEANKADVGVSKPVLLGEPKRFQSPALCRLEREIFRKNAFRNTKGENFEKTDDVHLISAQNIYDEARFTAQTIKTLVRETGCRYRDIVIIARSLELYKDILKPVFDKYEIPLFIDARRDIVTHPLIAFILSAFDVIRNNYKFDDVFRCLKTGIMDFSIEEISLLENYALLWDIRGREVWSSDFTMHPGGFAGEMREKDTLALSQLNEIRKRFIAPLSNFENKIKKAGCCREIAAALYHFLVSLGIEERIKALRTGLEAAGELELSDEYGQIWGVLTSTLDQMVLTMNDSAVGASDFADLFELALSNSSVSHIPSSLDAVTAGDADRIRAGNSVYAFLIGMAEGIFPQPTASGGVLSDSERRQLIDMGLELSPDGERRTLQERFFAYKAMTCAKKGLYISYPRSDASGRTLRPSCYLASLRAIFEQLDYYEVPAGNPLFEVQNAESAFELMALRYREKDELCEALKNYFENKPDFSQRMDAITNAADRKPAVFKDKAIAKKLYGDDIYISPSRMETFRECRFYYFCRYGLGAKPRGSAELAAPTIGSLIHFVLEKLLSETKEIWTLDDKTLTEKIRKLLLEYAKLYFGGLEDKAERFRYLFLRLQNDVVCLVRHIADELSQSSFVPAGFEMKIGEKGDVKPICLDLPDGGRIVAEGICDRADIMKKEGKTYLRVVDYKTGAKKFSLSDVLYGLNLQMLIYLFTLCKNYRPDGDSDKETILPAGILYVPAKMPEIMKPRGTDQAIIDKAMMSEFKMSGIVAADTEVARGMEKEAGGLFIPAKLVAPKDGLEPAFDARSSIATYEQFGLLERQIKRTLYDMASGLRSGDVRAVPVSGCGYEPCGYCEFFTACGHESDDEVEYLKKVDSETVWNKLSGGEQNGKKVD